MKNWDKNIDKQIKHSLEGVEFPFEEASWEKMGEALDKSEKKPAIFWMGNWRYRSIAVLILITSFFIYYWIDESGDKIAQKEKITVSPLNVKEMQSPDVVAGKADDLNSISNELSAKNTKQQSPKEEWSVVNDTNHNSNNNSEPIKSVSQLNSQLPERKKNKIAVVSDIISSDELSDYEKDFDSGSNQVNEEKLTGNSILNDGEINELLVIKKQEETPGNALTDEDSSITEKKVAILSREEKKKQKADAKEVRRLLGKRVQNRKLGAFSFLPAYYGIKGGTNSVINRFTGDGFVPVSGYHFSIYAQYYLKNNLMLQFDLANTNLDYNDSFIGFSRSTFIEDGQPNSFVQASTYSFRVKNMVFREIQFALQKPIGQKGTVELGAFGGLISGDLQLTEIINWPATRLKPAPRFIIPEPFKKIAYGGIIGYEYQLFNKLSIGGRYYYGFNNIRKEKFFFPIRNPKASRFQLALKFQINKTKKIEE